MYEEKSTPRQPGRRATLHDIAVASGITPLDATFVRMYMAEERDKLPKPTLYSRFMGNYIANKLTRAFVVCMAVAVIGLAAILLGQPLGFVANVAGIVGAVSVEVFALRYRHITFIVGYAYWEPKVLFADDLVRGSALQSRVYNAVSAMAHRLEHHGLTVHIIEHTLKQDEIVHDPVIELKAERYDDSIYVAIYDNHKGEATIAGMR